MQIAAVATVLEAAGQADAGVVRGEVQALAGPLAALWAASEVNLGGLV